ncbi:hypothetical protein JOF53_000450 [Crossiella equi]|uniref:SnoaL-like domain-containing protein n=1 Tax=Crossiella equi TaxID=130796 RepID=A0ABS5A4S3_9PSEU|nr:hypothetical protein [Crossiella equi]MBP2471578.1 hypothetical protein [Crossiella equi]
MRKAIAVLALPLLAACTPARAGSEADAVRQVVTQHSEALDNRAEATVADSLFREFLHYENHFAVSLQEDRYEQVVTKEFADHDLATRHLGLTWHELSLHDGANATAQVEAAFEYTSGTEPYLRERGVKLGQSATQRRTITLVKVEKDWRIKQVWKQPVNPR